MNDDDILKASRDAFLEEAAIMLAELEEALLSMTDDPSTETVNAAFRAAHTIKGSAGLFGFDRVVAFTHEVEALLDRMRSGKQSVDAAAINLLLACRDQIERLLRELSDGTDPAVNSAESQRLIGDLKAIMGVVSAAAPVVAAAPPAAAGMRADGGQPEWIVWVKFGPETFTDGFDPAAFLRYMAQLGEVMDTDALVDEVPLLDDIDAERCALGFVARLRTTADKQAIENVFEFVADSVQLRLVPSPFHIEHMKVLLSEVENDPGRLGETLVRIGAITRNELSQALVVQAASPDAKLGEILAEQKLAPEPIVQAVVQKQGQLREKKTEESRFIRVSAEKLDELISLIGELVIGVSAARIVANKREDADMLEVAERLEQLVEGARDHSLRLRMVPVGDTFSRFKRIVHDVSKSLGKDVDLVITGGDTELDKSMVEQIVDPLTHLVRNALDHGMETPSERSAASKSAKGRIGLNAYHDAGAIVIEVSDDGRGLSRERILAKAAEKGLIQPDVYLPDPQVWNLIFLPGFSTAEKVTDISGRGVGMDVVRRNIESLRGEVTLLSQTGQGSTVQIRLPLTLAIIDGFLIEVAGSTFVLPLDGVEECIEVPERGRDMLTPAGYFELRGHVIPLLDLARHFGLNGERHNRGSLVVVRHGSRRVGVRVDKLLGEHQTVIKPLGRLFNRMRCISGSTILGSGAVALILDIGALLADAAHHVPAAEAVAESAH
ncbi:MAG: hypothetical protein RL323_43 [Pseudomonadota bacterium]